MANLDSLGISSGYNPALDGQAGDNQTAGNAARFQVALDGGYAIERGVIVGGTV